jgi:hypothetical protein
MPTEIGTVANATIAGTETIPEANAWGSRPPSGDPNKGDSGDDPRELLALNPACPTVSDYERNGSADQQANEEDEHHGRVQDLPDPSVGHNREGVTHRGPVRRADQVHIDRRGNGNDRDACAGDRQQNPGNAPPPVAGGASRREDDGEARKEDERDIPGRATRRVGQDQQRPRDRSGRELLGGRIDGRHLHDEEPPEDEQEPSDRHSRPADDENGPHGRVRDEPQEAVAAADSEE